MKKLHVYPIEVGTTPTKGDVALCGHRKTNNEPPTTHFTCKHCRNVLKQALDSWRER